MNLDIREHVSSVYILKAYISRLERVYNDDKFTSDAVDAKILGLKEKDMRLYRSLS
jgi:hypothetical protein